MTDTTQATAAAPAKRAAIAKRDWIDANGNVVEKEFDATGFRYTYLKSGQSVEYPCGEAGKLVTCFAVMGGLTKVGNIVNSIVNADDYNGDDPMPDVREWMKGAEQGVWREPSEVGARGPKYDRDVLAGVLVTMLAAAAKGDVQHYREKLDDPKYYASVRQNAKVMNEYHVEMARRGSATAPDPTLLA